MGLKGLYPLLIRHMNGPNALKRFYIRLFASGAVSILTFGATLKFLSLIQATDAETTSVNLWLLGWFGVAVLGLPLALGLSFTLFNPLEEIEKRTLTLEKILGLQPGEARDFASEGEEGMKDLGQMALEKARFKLWLLRQGLADAQLITILNVSGETDRFVRKAIAERHAVLTKEYLELRKLMQEFRFGGEYLPEWPEPKSSHPPHAA